MHVQGKLNEEFLLFCQSTKAHCIFWYGCVIQLVIVLFNIGFFVAVTFNSKLQRGNPARCKTTNKQQNGLNLVAYLLDTCPGRA